MNEPTNHRRRGARVEALVADFQQLPTFKRHLYFYILLVLLALLGDTIKRFPLPPRSRTCVTVNQMKTP